MYTYISIYIHIYIYTYIYIYTHTHIYMYMRLRVCVSVFCVFDAGGNGADVACYLHVLRHIMHDLSFEPLFARVYVGESERERE